MTETIDSEQVGAFANADQTNGYQTLDLSGAAQIKGGWSAAVSGSTYWPNIQSQTYLNFPVKEPLDDFRNKRVLFTLRRPKNFPTLEGVFLRSNDIGVEWVDDNGVLTFLPWRSIDMIEVVDGNDDE